MADAPPPAVPERFRLVVHRFELPGELVDLAGRVGATVEAVEELSSALDRVVPGERCVVLSAIDQEPKLAGFAARWATPGFAGAAAIFVGPAPCLREAERQLAPGRGIRFVPEGDQFLPRLVTSLAGALHVSSDENSMAGKKLRAALDDRTPATFQLLGRSYALVSTDAKLTAGDVFRISVDTGDRKVELLQRVELDVGTVRHVVQLMGLGASELTALADAIEPPLPVSRGHARFAVPPQLKVVARASAAGSSRRSYLRVEDVSLAGFRWVAHGYRPAFRDGELIDASIHWGHNKLVCALEVQWQRPLEKDGTEIGVRIRSLDRTQFGQLHLLIRETQSRGLKARKQG